MNTYRIIFSLFWKWKIWIQWMGLLWALQIHNKKTKIWSGNNPSWPVYNIYRYMCKFLFRSGDWYVYLYQFSFPLKDDCTLDRRVLYIWKYLLLIWRTPPCGDKWQIICASSAVFHFTPVVSMQIKAKCQKPNQY